MMPFALESPRFANDPLIQQIAADPDGGVLKLGPGSPAGSVQALQGALFDLGWAARAVLVVLDRSSFVSGVFDGLTDETVIAYKTHYGIHFPPDQPTGFVDGFAGPRTFRKLDGHCVLFDEADAALATKASGVTALTGVAFGGTAPILGTTGAHRVAAGGGAAGIWFKRGVGAFLVQGLFFTTYAAQGSESGGLGFPLSDESTDGTGRKQVFEHGTIEINPDLTAVVTAEPSPPIVSF